MDEVDLPEDNRLGRQENNKRTALWGLLEHTRTNSEYVDRFSHKAPFLTLSNALIVAAIGLLQRGIVTPAAILKEHEDVAYADVMYRYIKIYGE